MMSYYLLLPVPRRCPYVPIIFCRYYMLTVCLRRARFVYLLFIVLFGLEHLIRFVHLINVSIVIGHCPNLLPLFLSLTVRPICCTLAVNICTIPFLCFIGPFSPCPLQVHYQFPRRCSRTFIIFNLLNLLPVDVVVLYLFGYEFLDPSLYLFPFINVVGGVALFERCSHLLN